MEEIFRGSNGVKSRSLEPMGFDICLICVALSRIGASNENDCSSFIPRRHKKIKWEEGWGLCVYNATKGYAFTDWTLPRARVRPFSVTKDVKI